MKVRKQFEVQPMELNMTPMIDCVFQLLIFFLVVSEFASYDRIQDLILPFASEARPEEVLPDRLVISVDKQNRIWVQGRQQPTIAAVEQFLRREKALRKAEAGKKTGQPILIQADEHCKWRAIQDIIEKANALQFYKLSFSAKKERGGD